ncbi:hypothetical protein CC1G_14326 [Coprinopsis cinerea okayama7|uniref:Uncharacterized protein n=1 Tax=Coprinopsis cinerea (strain Okayama-7 / 130 / ATCC MYA-4618 / FGSC 9003) TaxID=240176 RepID=D6RLZ8_COPC7|nr:hypothetical protein CC1G_14326 [Coprinopsis cinerea okayama7\|eukprot:XP_002911331.1 hypothetical protein CC1G_14326 [Coprinopsis cinerea okayama7\
MAHHHQNEQVVKTNKWGATVVSEFLVYGPWKNISSFAFDFLDPLNSGVAVTSSLVQDRQTDELLPGKCEVARQIYENKVTKPKTIETTTGDAGMDEDQMGLGDDADDEEEEKTIAHHEFMNTTDRLR